MVTANGTRRDTSQSVRPTLRQLEDVFLAINESQAASRVQGANVTRVEPAVSIHHLICHLLCHKLTQWEMLASLLGNTGPCAWHQRIVAASAC